MSGVFISPLSFQRWFNATGTAPLSGGQLFFYAAGTVTPQTTYTDITGSTPNANPVILGATGLPPNEIWFTAGLKYKCVIEDSLNNPVGIILDNLAGMNDTGAVATTQEWLASPTPTFVNATSFTVVGDQRTTYTQGRRIQATVTAGVVYGSIISAVFTSLTTITVVMDPGQALDSGLSAVNVGITSYVNTSVPLPNPGGGTVASAATLNLETASNYANVITGTTTITAVTLAQGKARTLIAQTAGLTVSNNSPLLTTTGRNIVCAAGDRLTFTAENGNVYVTISRLLYPNFQVSGSVNITVTSAGTKISLNTATFNDGTNFDTVTNFRFTPTVPGRYQFDLYGLVLANAGAGSFSAASVNFYKNGVTYQTTVWPAPASQGNQTLGNQAPFAGSIVVDMNGSTDYLEIFGACTINAPMTATFSANLSGFKVDP